LGGDDGICANTSQPIDTGVYGWAVGDTAGGYGTIIHTNDGGNTWVEQTSPFNLALRRISFASALR